ncbi:MAG: GLPGLI family protein [Saprospiraceae bacterium]|nr:GLPGLI family protein [Saprospiraceae bacterium]
MKFLFISLLILSATIADAQSAGMITYEEKMDLHKNLPPDRQDMKDMIPQFNISKFELIFSGDESIYRAQKQEELPATSSSPGGPPMGMRFGGGRANRVVYKDLAKDTMIDSRDFMQKQFLITGPPKPRKWKIGIKHKEILGYNCLEASFRADSVTTMVAWFSPQLPIPNGPSDYQGLPGMILQVDVNDGERMVTATEINIDSVDTTMIVAPSKGKEVTPEEFEKIREEKMKEMGMQQGAPGGGQHMFMIRQ